MHPMAAYQVSQSKKRVLNEVLSDSNMRQKYKMHQKRRKRLDDLEEKCRYDYWLR